jgi:uncharacterized protein
MSTDILNDARTYLVNSCQGKQNHFDTLHPWRKDWQFAVLHSLRVDAYVLKILAREDHVLSEPEIVLLRLAAILHDIARLDQREHHAQAGADIARRWFQTEAGRALHSTDIEKVLAMIADHSNKTGPERDFSKAVLKDADTLDEIGVMSIFMTSNWLEKQSPFFFHDLRQRLIDFELPFCDKKLAVLNTAGAKAILREKRAFIEFFLAQLADEIQTPDTTLPEPFKTSR